MLTSMAIYSLYKYYKKWRGGTGPGGGGDLSPGSDAASGTSLMPDEYVPSDKDRDRDDEKNSIFSIIANYSKYAQLNFVDNAKNVLICTLYMILGPSLILLNKHILTDLQVCCMLHVICCMRRGSPEACN